MARIAFRMRVKQGKLDEYVRIHAEVWPELLADMTAAGYHNYSIFADGHDLFGIFEVDDFDTSQAALATSDANRRWQTWMTEYLETPIDPEGKTGMNIMPEIFRME